MKKNTVNNHKTEEDPLKTLFVISKGLNKQPDDIIREMEENDLCPRMTYLEDELNTELLDERYLRSVPLWRRWIYSLLPTYICQIIESFLIQNQYDLVLSYYERVGLPLALLQKIFKRKTPHILMTSWLSSPEKVWFLKRVHESLSQILVWSSVQYDYAVNEIGIPPEKLTQIRYGTDQKFWRPIDSETDRICSAGMEMRDYPTLIEALRTLDIPCHIATGESRGVLFDTVRRLYEIEDIPSHITVGAKKYPDLRAMYARSRFVVVPLLQTDTDNGLTVILESMAMGKPVICSRVQGQVDLVEDGVTGIFVEQGDPEALREAILDLWNHPEKCREMGAAAREFIEQEHNLEQFVDSIKAEATKAVINYDPSEEFNLREVEAEA